MERGAATAEAAGSGGSSLPSSSLPWHQIPRFEPGVMDLRNYAKKLEFIRDLWPEEHIAHLAPRAASVGGWSGLPKGREACRADKLQNA